MMRALLVGALLLSLARPSSAQSTSPWIRIGTSALGDSSVQNPSAGATYVTVALRGATVYQNSNWWTSFVERNRQAVLTVGIDGMIAGRRISDTRMAKPIELRRNDASVDLGYSGLVFEQLPTTFSGLSVTVAINKSAADGLQGLLDAVSEISQSTPSLTVSHSSMGIVSASKTVADFLFGKRLLEQKLISPSPFASSALVPAGVYVVLAGDSRSDYAQYLTPSNGQPGLQWTNGGLIWNGNPVSRLSYFVIEVAYSRRVFSNPMDALSYSPQRSWAALFELARRKVTTITSRETATRITDEIRSHLFDAATLLGSDPDFIQAEKDAINTSIYSDIQNQINQRISVVAPPAGPGAPGAPSPIILRLPDILNSADILKDIQANAPILNRDVVR